MKAAMPDEDLDARWRLRENHWRRKLGRLRLGVEPIEEQLARYRRVTWALTAVPSVVGLMFIALFTVFGRTDIGLIFVAIVLLPIVAGAWIDHALLARRARCYLAERDDYMQRKEQMQSAAAETRATSGQA
jgi:hypothetical protein